MFKLDSFHRFIAQETKYFGVTKQSNQNTTQWLVKNCTNRILKMFSISKQNIQHRGFKNILLCKTNTLCWLELVTKFGRFEFSVNKEVEIRNHNEIVSSSNSSNLSVSFFQPRKDPQLRESFPAFRSFSSRSVALSVGMMITSELNGRTILSLRPVDCKPALVITRSFLLPARENSAFNITPLVLGIVVQWKNKRYIQLYTLILRKGLAHDQRHLVPITWPGHVWRGSGPVGGLTKPGGVCQWCGPAQGFRPVGVEGVARLGDYPTQKGGLAWWGHLGWKGVPPSTTTTTTHTWLRKAVPAYSRARPKSEETIHHITTSLTQSHKRLPAFFFSQLKSLPSSTGHWQASGNVYLTFLRRFTRFPSGFMSYRTRNFDLRVEAL